MFYFTNKSILKKQSGLAQCLEPFKNAVTNLMFPRCHYIRNKQDYNIFMDDYMVTALVSTLKIIVQAIEKNKIIFSENGNVSNNSINCIYCRNNTTYYLIRRYPTK